MGWTDYITNPFKIVKDVGGKLFGNGNDDMKRLMNDQMRAYKEQTELTRKELEAKRTEVDAQKRRIQEKQIRGLRRNYRSPGLLGTGQSSSPDMSSTLGG